MVKYACCLLVCMCITIKQIKMYISLYILFVINLTDHGYFLLKEYDFKAALSRFCICKTNLIAKNPSEVTFIKRD